MMNNDYKELKKSIDELTKKINQGFIALNENLKSCAKSLKNLSDQYCQNSQSDDELGPLICSSNDTWIDVNDRLPGPELELSWVLVKIKCTCNDIVLNMPKFGKYIYGKWWDFGTGEPFETEKVPFEVIKWKPID